MLNADKIMWLRRNYGCIISSLTVCMIADGGLGYISNIGLRPVIYLDILLVALCFWVRSWYRAGSLKIFLIHAVIVLLAAAGLVLYLADGVFMPISPPVLISSCIFIAIYYMLLLAVYFFISSAAAPHWVLSALRVLLAWILLLPLLGYISFDLHNMIIMVNVLELDPVKILSDFSILRCLTGFLIKSLLALIGIFMCLLPLEVCRTAEPVRKTLKIMIPVLLAALAAFTLTDNPVCKLMLYETEFDKAMKVRQNPLTATDNYQVEENTLPGLYFLIVGESYDWQRAEALRQYGTFYDKIHQEEGYFVFSDAHSVAKLPNEGGMVGGSQYAIVNMLHDSHEPQQQEYLIDHPHLFDVLEYCGVKTFTISNYGPYRAYANAQRHITEKADHLVINDRSSFNGKYRKLGFQIDNEIPGILQKWYSENTFDKQKSFTFIQPLGLHYYEIILPEEHCRKYKDMGVPDDKNRLNFGCLYFDAAAENIVKTMQSFPETQVIIFCSDHPWSRNGDIDRIVMFIYLSEDFRKAHPDLTEKVKKMSSEKFNTVNMYHLILELMNIKVTKK